VDTSSNPYLDGDGLAWASLVNTANNPGFNLWGNGPGSYTLFDASDTEYYGANGAATLTAVPDGGMTFGLLGGALVGLQALRRKLFC
jgi:hypothetical protein